jgi:predicted amidohydrolase
MSRSDNQERPLIAVAQYSPEHGQVERNRRLSEEWIAIAGGKGAKLLVLPECCVTGLVFEDRATLFDLAEELEGPTTASWRHAASAAGIYVVAGMAVRDGDQLFNTAVVVTPDGILFSYRKTHVFGQEQKLFNLGDRLVCVDTPWGRLGLAVCYDLWFPEMVRNLAIAGADLIASPSNWFAPPRQAGDAADALPMAFHHAVAAACSNEVTIACAGRTGEEGGVRFLGGSFIVGPNGRPLVGPAQRVGEACLVAPWPDAALTRMQVQSHLETRREALYRQPVSILGGRETPP